MALCKNTTLAALSSDYLNNVIKDYYAESTYQSYKTRLDKYVLPSLGAIKVSDLKKLDIQNLIWGLGKASPSISPITVRLVRSILNRILDFAVDIEIVQKNVSDRILLPSLSKYQPRVYTLEEALRLMNIACGTILYMPIFIALNTGLRRSEILALEWRDIDFDNGIIAVRKAVQGRHMSHPKTTKSCRHLKVSAMLINALKEHQHKQKHHHAYVICKEDGGLYNPSYISRAFNELLKKNGMPLIRFHDLRHTYATHAHFNGMPAKALSLSLGHQSSAITLDNYVHFSSVGKE